MIGNAKRELTEAQTSLTSADSIVQSAVTSDHPREAFETVKTHFLTAAQSIRDTRTHLITTISLLRDATKAQVGQVSEQTSNSGN